MLLQFKMAIFFLIYLQCIPVMVKLNFQHHYSSLQYDMILQKSF